MKKKLAQAEMTAPDRRPYIWRGPFRVARAGRQWKIINRYGEDERVGFNYQGAAIETCRLQNLAAPFCDVGERKP